MTEVRTERTGSALLITIDRPQVRNAVNAAVATALSAALDELEASPELRVGVLTGAGGSFSAGMDLKAAMRGESPVVDERGLGGLTEAELTKPLIAAVEGFALGGGFELALACDLIVAAEDARFGLPEVKRGLIAGAGGVVRLPHRIPHHLAMELLLTGEPIDGRRAGELGLANRVVSNGDAVAVALRLAERIAVNAPLALAAVKAVVRSGDPWAAQRTANARLMTTEDVREGMTAFAERRAPRWTGR
ncbi:crotonase/enoyl-CoA hydratase family protein [Lentzea sp. NPDC060358]|uniref:crotonase/enoyl-CoA hydratase family protein n=1 Tax=Lentzea sp. NPDC060358 TaxID=3347103 RepID=UPI0036488F33